MNLKQLLMLLGLVRPEKILYIGGSDVLPPPLPPEEERTLIARLAEGDEQARQTLIERNLRLVVYIARRFENTDHTREYIPMIALGKQVRPVNLGTRPGFCDIAATVAELLDVPYETPGRSFAHEIV